MIGGAMTIAAIVRETYGAHYVLWNLGIEPGAITVVVAPRVLPDETAVTVGVSVCVNVDGKSFTMPVGPELATSEAREAFNRAWAAHVESLPERRRTDLAGLDRDARDTYAWSRKVEIVYAMLRKGFDLRAGALN